MANYCPEKDGPALYPDCIECRKEGTPFCKKFFLLVAGSRTFNDYDLLKTKLDHILKNRLPEVVIVSGGAEGADSLAERYAKERGLPVRIFNAEWEKYGKAAGYKRNSAMHDYICNATGEDMRGCVCFWNGKSKGTAQNFKLAEDRDTPLRTIIFK